MQLEINRGHFGHEIISQVSEGCCKNTVTVFFMFSPQVYIDTVFN